MNPKKIVKLSNAIGIVSIVLLVYWVFVFITVEVFGLKVFRENITQTFYLSILGILALMFGALIINIMFNLTRIAQKHNNDPVQGKNGKLRVRTVVFIASFPVIFGLLFGGDYLSTKRREKLLIRSAESIVSDYSAKANQLLDYSFGKKWIDNAEDILYILSKTDKHFPHITVVVKDTISGSPLYLVFDPEYNHEYSEEDDKLPPLKKQYIMETTKPERDYLQGVFAGKSNAVRFSAHDGRYQLFYPYGKDDRMIVFLFSDYKRHGKFGS
ncbi:MAG: hypothetical protein MI784_04490 [Cytophagales bacterium]|nr:hypothetical protein [Cytophagales bacterium]